MATWQESLSAPIGTEGVGLTDRERQQIYGLARKQIQGGWGAATETLKGQLAGRGLRVGEAGMADTALGQLYAQGAEQLGQAGTTLAAEEARNRASEKQALEALRTGRGAALGGIEAQMAQVGATAGATSAAERIAGERLGWEKEQFGQTFPYQQQQDALSQLFALYGGMAGEQQQIYAPYYEAIASNKYSYGG